MYSDQYNSSALLDIGNATSAPTNTTSADAEEIIRLLTADLDGQSDISALELAVRSADAEYNAILLEFLQKQKHDQIKQQLKEAQLAISKELHKKELVQTQATLADTNAEALALLRQETKEQLEACLLDQEKSAAREETMTAQIESLQNRHTREQETLEESLLLLERKLEQMKETDLHRESLFYRTICSGPNDTGYFEVLWLWLQVVILFVFGAFRTDNTTDKQSCAQKKIEELAEANEDSEIDEVGGGRLGSAHKKGEPLLQEALTLLQVSAKAGSVKLIVPYQKKFRKV